MTQTQTYEEPQWSAWQECRRHSRLYLKVGVGIIVIVGIMTLFLPDVYVAQTEIVDERRELGLRVGLNQMSALMSQKLLDNEGFHTPMVYGKIIDSPDFARKLSHMTVPGYGTTYAEYLTKHHKKPWWTRLFETVSNLTEGEDSFTETSINLIQQTLKYEVSERHLTILLQVSDNDRRVAVAMVDSARHLLQTEIEAMRRKVQETQLRSSQEQLEKTKSEFIAARKAYNDYCDSHFDLSTPSERSRARALKGDMEVALNAYDKAGVQYARDKYLTQRNARSFVTLKTASATASPFLPHRLLIVLTWLIVGFIILTWYLLGKRSLKERKQKNVVSSTSPE